MSIFLLLLLQVKGFEKFKKLATFTQGYMGGRLWFKVGLSSSSCSCHSSTRSSFIYVPFCFCVCVCLN